MTLVDRFLSYVAISSQSDASTKDVPSSEGQWELARVLMAELEELGLADIHLSDKGCLTAVLPGTATGRPIGFVTHLDTADVNMSPDVHPRIITIGQDTVDGLHDPAIHEDLASYIGEQAIVADGTSVLGADDKSAIASVMEALATIVTEERDHPEIHVAFVPDEEIGLRGAKVLDLDRFRPDYAYTIDCEGEGTIAYETFNAGYAHVAITGVAAHPMSAKGIMVNPNLVAHDLVACFDRSATPECTEGREGYIWVQQVSGNQSTASVTLNIRDHDRDAYLAKKDEITAAVDKVRGLHPRASIELVMEDVYGNIADALGEANQWVVDVLKEAVRRESLEPIELVMRGGTDGSYLSTQGIPTPNIFTGGFNFHSRREFLPLRSFEASYRVVLRLATTPIPDPA